MFSEYSSLQTHCRRKGHPLPSLKPVTEPEAHVPIYRKAISQVNANGGSSRKYLKIAPMPSLTMTAAIALSELSSKTSTNNPFEDKSKKVQDKPLWSASTQTSPRGEQEPSEESILPVSRTSRPIPKLGDPKLEQFSTETQTDDLEQLLLKPNTSNVDAFTIEAQTQFDLDDILCSNYTQTIFDTSLDPSSTTASGAPVNTEAETQTNMLMSSYDLVNIQTQTMSMLFGDHDDEQVNP